MKYILKYQIKSKYFGFVKEDYKEFDSLFKIFHFITNNPLVNWKVYKEYEIQYTEMLGDEK